MSAQVVRFNESTLIEVVRAAKAAGMHLIHDGREIKVSPIIPPGWREVIVKIKAPQRRAA